MENKLLRSYFNQEVRIYNLFGFHVDRRAGCYSNATKTLPHHFHQFLHSALGQFQPQFAPIGG